MWAIATKGGNRICFTVPTYSRETVLLLEFETEKKKARRQFSAVSLILSRLLNAQRAAASLQVQDGPVAANLLRVVSGQIRSGTGKALWWRDTPPTLAVLAGTAREGARALANRLRQALCSYGASSLGLEGALYIEFGISVYPEEELDGPDLIAAAAQDKARRVHRFLGELLDASASICHLARAFKSRPYHESRGIILKGVPF